MPRKKIVNKQPTRLYCGLDLSLTATGVVIINQSGVVVHKQVIKTKVRGMERLFVIRNIIADIYKRFAINFTCVEGYSMGSRNGKAFDIGELGGTIKLFLWSRKHDYYPIPPTQVKKYATGKGNGDKNKVMLAVFKEWQFEGTDDNEVDAFVLANIARAVKSNIVMRKYQAEAIISIRKEINKGV